MQHLTKNDLRGLRKAVRSPFFNQREDVVRLFDALEERLDRGPISLERERVFRLVFPENKTFDMPILRHASSFLLDTIRQFLAVEEMRSDAAAADFFLQSAYKKRGAEEPRERVLADALAAHESRSLRNGHFHQQHFQFLLEDLDLRARHNRATDAAPMLRAMTAAQTSTLLRVGCTAASAQNFSGKTLDVPYLKTALELAESGQFDDLPAVMVYFHTFRCLESSENDAHFQKLKALLPALGEHFLPSEAGDVLLAAINFCIRRANQGRPDFLKEAFELYKIGFENRALLPSGTLTKYTYKNATALGLHLGEFEWVADFLEKYRPFLPERDRENNYRINRAKLFFNQKKYDDALVELQSVRWSEEALYNLDARRMLVRIFWETKAFSALEAQLESYKTYLRRHRDELGYYRDIHLHLIQFVQKMMRSDLSSERVRRGLREQVEAEKSVAEKAWLLEKLA